MSKDGEGAAGDNMPCEEVGVDAEKVMGMLASLS